MNFIQSTGISFKPISEAFGSQAFHSEIHPQAFHSEAHVCDMLAATQAFLNEMSVNETPRGGGLGSSTIFKKFNEPYAPS